MLLRLMDHWMPKDGTRSIYEGTWWDICKTTLKSSRISGKKSSTAFSPDPLKQLRLYGCDYSRCCAIATWCRGYSAATYRRWWSTVVQGSGVCSLVPLSLCYDSILVLPMCVSCSPNSFEISGIGDMIIMCTGSMYALQLEGEKFILSCKSKTGK